MDDAALQRTWYLAGPMSGIPRHNIPMFDRVTAALRRSGFTVINPAELDSGALRRAGLADTDGLLGTPGHEDLAGETWGSLLARDVKLVADKAAGVALLPGWQKSRGARLETFIALTAPGDYDFMEVNEGPDGKLYMSNVRPDYIKAEVFKHV